MSKADNKIVIAHLYPETMNLYGDTGNVIVLKKRLEWRNIQVQVVNVGVGQDMPQGTDIVFGGGGQDASQGMIEEDFIHKKKTLENMASDGVVMLFICGLYQLMGRKFTTHTGDVITGLGILPIETVAKNKRLIGNIVINIKDVGKVVGYENHSGQTFLDNEDDSLGQTLKGVGNNQMSGNEGCRYKNVFGTYLHGPVLAKSPEFADFLIDLALSRKGKKLAEYKNLDDSLEKKASEIACAQPR